MESWPLFGFSKIQKLTHHPRTCWSKWWTGGRSNGYIYIEGMKGTSLPFPFSVPLSLHRKVRQGVLGEGHSFLYQIILESHTFFCLGDCFVGGGIGGYRYWNEKCTGIWDFNLNVEGGGQVRDYTFNQHIDFSLDPCFKWKKSIENFHKNYFGFLVGLRYML